MTVYELMRMNESLLKVIAMNDVLADDVQHLAMYEEYVRMKEEGHKLMYIVAFLQDEYGVSESTAYRVIKRMSKGVKM